VRICKIWDADYPWDVRVEKIVSSLNEAGHEVHLVCRNLARRPAYERLEDMQIHRLPILPGSALNYLASFPAFCNPLWLSKIRQVIRKNSIDLLMVRDLPMAPAAVLVARRCGIPVVFDMAEDYPAMIRDVWRFEDFRLSNFLVRNPAFVDRIERLCIRKFDQILTVVDESSARLIDQYGIEPDRVQVVSNTPKMAGLPCVDASTNVAAEENKPLKLIYVGGLEPARNLEVVIRGMSLDAANLDCSLCVLGKGTGEASLKSLTDELGMRERVEFRGFLEHSAIADVLQASDVGVIPHPATDHTNTTVPNKLFDYMAYGKPVLASDTRPVQRIIESEDCGLVFRYDSPQEFRNQLGRLADSELRRSMGDRGRKAVEREYNWEVDAERLVEFLAEELTQSDPLSERSLPG
jgi:glycosyltransferase involved in cell wall biosynthesis